MTRSKSSSHRASDDDDSEYAPRPLHTYLFIGICVVIVVAGAYLNSDSITAFVTDVADAVMPSTISTSEPSVQALPEPDCANECGRACWLIASGSAEGNPVDAGGSIGTLGCDDKCWSIADSVERCCRNSNCPKNTICKNGTCSSE